MKCRRCNGTGWLEPIGPCSDGSYITSRRCSCPVGKGWEPEGYDDPDEEAPAQGVCIDCEGVGRYPAGHTCKSCGGSGRVGLNDAIQPALVAGAIWRVR